MGVRGLETFLEKHCPEACKKVEISELANQFKQNTGLEPILVVDINSCSQFFCNFVEDQDWLLGSNYKECQALIEKFIKAFVRIGVKLVIFLDGLPVNERHELYLQRADKRKQHLFQVFDLLYEGNRRAALETAILHPHCLKDVFRVTFLSSDCTCYYTVKDADNEIARYSAVNKCFGVLAQDSDYAVMEHAYYYFSMKHFDLENLTTICYSRRELANRLRIDVRQLPLLATLCGNDVISADTLKDFHRYVSGWRGYRIPFEVIYQSVANYIRNLPIGKEILNCLDDISLDVFRNKHGVDKLRLSLYGYWTEKHPIAEAPEMKNVTNWKKILKAAKERFINCNGSRKIYTILLDKVVYLGMSYEDARNRKYLFSYDILLVLRQRLYGLLLKEKEIDKQHIFVNEWYLNSTVVMDRPKHIYPIYPDYHPGLLTLWNDADQSLDAQKTRWRCFCEAISKRLNYEEIMKLKHDLIIPVLALFYLNHEVATKILHPWEIEALLAQAVLVNKLSLKDTLKYRAGYFDERTVYLASLFEWTCDFLDKLSGVCGYPVTKLEGLIVNFFNGKIFNSIYSQCKNGVPGDKLCGNETSQIETYNSCLSVVFSKQKQSEARALS